MAHMSLTAALSAVGGAGAAAVPAPDDDFGAALALLGGGADVRLGDCVPILDDPLSGSFTELYGFVDKRFPPTDERAFCCLGMGGFGVVFEGFAKPAAYPSRFTADIVPHDLVIAVKQVYKDSVQGEEVWKREVKLMFSHRNDVLNHPHARSTICVPLDAFRYPLDADTGKFLIRIIMHRSPVAKAFAYAYDRPAPASPANSSVPNHRAHPAPPAVVPLGGSGADLVDFLDRLRATGRTITDAQVHYIMVQLLTALDFIHSEKGMVHRDVKTENILVWGTHADGLLPDGTAPLAPVVLAGAGEALPWIKLADFGLARELALLMTTDKGTYPFMAPDLVRPSYTSKADVFSAGCVLYNLLTGAAPGADFEDAALATRFPRTSNPACRLREGRPFWAAFKAMVQENAELRPSARHLLSNPDYFGMPMRI